MNARADPVVFHPRWRRWTRVIAGGYAVAVLIMVVMAGVAACRRQPETVERRLPSTAVAQTAESCRSCHEQAHALWHGTDHALANRRMSPEADGPAFAAGETVHGGKGRVRMAWTAEGPEMRVPMGEGEETFRPDFVLGHRPLRQFLVPTAGGRWQPVEWAWDPAQGDWFNVFGDEQRQPGEWGHWTGRGMNWNSMCAHCHMTGFQKHYDVTTDAYRSTWVEQGISCLQCHGPMPAGHGTPRAKKPSDDGVLDPTWMRDRQRAMHTCAYCHARNEPLTAEFPPGDDYHDHFRVTLPVQPGVFHPDGQQLDEDFNWTSVLLSRMHHAGVTCADCHDPHSTATILPVQNNALCMQCHSAPGRVMPTTGVQTPVIDPLAHSRHAEGSTGNQCVTCHMPTATYMARAPRHDHGWLIPDPLLTKELGIPNACNGCHTDKTVEWAIEAAEAWYGPKLESRQRDRARAVAAAQRGEEAAVEAILRLFREEDIPAWRATYLQLVAPWAGQSRVVTAARESLGDGSPLVRASAVQALTGDESARPLLRPLLQDPVRLVRLDAAWALGDELDPASPVATEFMQYLRLAEDQPGGQFRLGQYFANTGRLVEADRAMARAIEWDPFSPGFYDGRASVLLGLNRPAEAAAALFRAAQLQPGQGEPMMRAALAFAEAGKPDDAQAALRQAVAREPQLHRAWYNLGLLLAQSERLEESAAALQRAATVAPHVPDYPYALATVLLRQGDRAGARAAAERALQADPNYVPARRLLQVR
jgi:predicted CXXCH cytochrome family protein